MDISHFRQDFGLLVEGGFIAVKQGNRDAAEKLFRAAQVLNPEHSAPKIGFGYIALNSMNLVLARKYFEEVLQKEPDNASAKIYLGFCFILTKAGYKKRRQQSINPEEIDALALLGAKLVKEAMASTDAPEIKHFGDAALELLKKMDDYQDIPLKTPAKAN